MLNRAAASVLAIVLLLIAVSSSLAQEASGQAGMPNASAIVHKINQALDPPIPSVRLMTLKVSGPRAYVAQWKMAQARDRIKNANWMLTVVLLPASWGEGIALLDESRPPAVHFEEVYLPAFHRVRRFTPLQVWEPFFGSDFTYEDFGFPQAGKGVRLTGIEKHDGRKCYVLEETLVGNPYYSRLKVWADVDTGLPIERDYYDVTGKLYKAERYEQIVAIQDIPTITRIVMTDLQQGSRSELDVTAVKYYKKPPAKLFNPDYLPQAAADKFWKGAL